MNLLQRLGLLSTPEIKESQARIVSTYNQVGNPVYTGANYEGFSEQGYKKNVVVFIAVSKIATACGGINWVLYQKSKGRKAKRTEIGEHKLIDLLASPNPYMGTSTFIENVIAYHRIAGNSYVEANFGLNVEGLRSNVPLELWPMRPDRVEIIAGQKGYVGAYVYKSGGREARFPVDPTTLHSQVMHWKTFNPTNDWYGMSFLEAAIASLDQNNAGKKWNLSLLQNSAAPSGLLQMKVTEYNPRGALTDEQYKKVKAELKKHQGPRGAGLPLVIEGGLSWQQISLSPKDMDFLETTKMSATDLTLALGVPPEISGLGVKTFANYKEARESFYTETILPTMDSLKDKFNQWLTPSFGDGLELDYDKDDIDALVEKRQAKYTSLGSAKFLNENEKRVAAGYEEQPGLDVWVIEGQVISKQELENSVKEDTADVAPQLEPQQITSLLDIIDRVTSGKLPKPTGVQIIMTSFGMTEDDANKLLKDIEVKPTDEVDDEKPPSNESPGKSPSEQESDENENDTGDSDESDDDDESNDESGDKGYKIFNLLNRNERRQTWKRQNAKKENLSRYFRRDLADDFASLTKKLKAVADANDKQSAKTIEMLLTKVTIDWSNSELKQTLKKWTKTSLEEFGEIVLNQGKALPGYKIETKANLKYDQFVTEYIQRRTGTQIKTIQNTTEKQIKRIVSEWTQEAINAGDTVNDLSFYLQTEFEELGKSNAQRIARTEVGLASNNGTLNAVKSLAIPGMVKEWVSASDSRVRDGDKGGADHTSVNANNGEIPLDEKFKVEPDQLMDGPGDESAPADQVINCRCVLAFKNKGD